MEVASIDAFERNPARVWDFYARRVEALGAVEPNDGHRAVAELETRGFVQAIVTQNVDGLHQRAGAGRSSRCTGLSITPSVRPAEPGSRSPRCCGSSRTPGAGLSACGDVLKPGVVLFGEVLPAAAITRAVELARGAELMLVVGSSLAVWPVAGLPLEARRSRFSTVRPQRTTRVRC